MTSIALPRHRTIQPHVYSLPVVRELPPVSRPATFSPGW